MPMSSVNADVSFESKSPMPRMREAVAAPVIPAVDVRGKFTEYFSLEARLIALKSVVQSVTAAPAVTETVILSPVSTEFLNELVPVSFEIC